MWGSCDITWYLYCKIIFFRSFVYVYIFPVIIFYILHVFITCKTFALLTSESAVHDQTVTINDECTDCYGAYLTMVPPSLMSVSTWRKLLNTATTTNKGGFRLRGFTTHRMGSTSPLKIIHEASLYRLDGYLRYTMISWLRSQLCRKPKINTDWHQGRADDWKLKTQLSDIA